MQGCATEARQDRNGLAPGEGSRRSACPVHAPHPPQVCHLDRSVPGFPTSLLLTTATYAALREERRTTLTDLTTPHRKSGGAQWRDLQSAPPQNQSPFRNPSSPFVISTGAQRSGEIFGSAPPPNQSPLPQPLYPLSSRPERSAVERSAVRPTPKPISPSATSLSFVISTGA